MAQNIDTYVQNLGKMKSERNTLDSYWQDVSTYCIPMRDFTTSRTQGDNRVRNLYTSIGIENTEALASALHAMLTPDTSQWMNMKLMARNGRNYSSRMHKWAEDTAKRMYEVFTSRSNMLHLNLHEAYIDIVSFGNAAMFIGKRDGDIYFRTRQLRDCWIRENDSGVIDTLYYSCKMYVSDLVNEFGEENVHPETLKLGMSEKVEVLYAVEPREVTYGVGSAKKYKPFTSIYIDLKAQHIMKEDGFDVFPYVFPRFAKRAGEDYGYGPSMNALPTIKEMNKILEIMSRAGAKAVDGPILSPAEGLIGQPRLDPASIIFYDPDMPEPKPWNNSFRPDYFEYVLTRHESTVRNFYFTNWLSMPQQPNMTATEVIQRTQESLRMLGPMLARLHSEMHIPLLDRSFAICMELGYLEEPPEDLYSEDIMWEFTSQMDQAQRMSSANSILQGLGLVAQVGQYDQAAFDTVNTTVLLEDSLVSNYNWPLKYINSAEEVAAKGEERQSMQELQQLSEVASNAAGAVKGLGGAI